MKITNTYNHKSDPDQLLYKLHSYSYRFDFYDTSFTMNDEKTLGAVEIFNDPNDAKVRNYNGKMYVKKIVYFKFSDKQRVFHENDLNFLPSTSFINNGSYKVGVNIEPGKYIIEGTGTLDIYLDEHVFNKYYSPIESKKFNNTYNIINLEAGQIIEISGKIFGAKLLRCSK